MASFLSQRKERAAAALKQQVTQELQSFDLNQYANPADFDPQPKEINAKLHAHLQKAKAFIPSGSFDPKKLEDFLAYSLISSAKDPLKLPPSLKFEAGKRQPADYSAYLANPNADRQKWLHQAVTLLARKLQTEHAQKQKTGYEEDLDRLGVLHGQNPPDLTEANTLLKKLAPYKVPEQGSKEKQKLEEKKTAYDTKATELNSSLPHLQGSLLGEHGYEGINTIIDTVNQHRESYLTACENVLGMPQNKELNEEAEKQQSLLKASIKQLNNALANATGTSASMTNLKEVITPLKPLAKAANASKVANPANAFQLQNLESSKACSITVREYSHVERRYRPQPAKDKDGNELKFSLKAALSAASMLQNDPEFKRNYGSFTISKPGALFQKNWRFQFKSPEARNVFIQKALQIQNALNQESEKTNVAIEEKKAKPSWQGQEPNQRTDTEMQADQRASVSATQTPTPTSTS